MKPRPVQIRCPGEQVLHCRDMPIATACATYAAGVERRGDSGESSGSRFLVDLDDRQNVRREPVGFAQLRRTAERRSLARIDRLPSVAP